MKLNNLIASGLLSGLLLATAILPSVVHADTVDQLQSSLNDVKQQMSQASQEKSQLQAQSDQLQQTITVVNQKLQENQQNITGLNQQTDKINQQIDKSETKLKALQVVLDQQIKAMYENGTVSYLSVLMDSTSFSDFMDRFEAIRMIAKSNKQSLEKVQALKKQLQQQKMQFEHDLQEIQRKQQELAILRQTDVVLQKQQKDKLAHIQSTIDSSQQRVNQLQQEIEFAKQEAIYSQQHPITDSGASFYSGDNLVAGASGNGIVSYAESFMGTPYQWGGTRPGGFDCSGYTQYVFRHFGVNLSRTSQSQFNEGQSVSYSDLKPGDLVFFSTYAAGATHVGIYIGSGLMVNAEDRGVRIDNISDSYWGPIYLGARRIVQ